MRQNPLMRPSVRSIPALLALAGLASCSSVYYATMEKFGYAKRDILVDRVKEGREEQQGAQKQFQTTFEAFKALTGFQGGKLEETYDRLRKELDRCKSSAEGVTGRIASIEKVAKDMFSEWKQENSQYTSPELRSKSEKLLADTQQRYDKLIGAMKTAESRMPPVIAKFNDQVLFLKHNLNAQAIASLQDTVMQIEGDVGRLLDEMKRSITEADAFISSMGSGG